MAGRALAFIGLGVMGYPMAAHLLKAGHSVCVYNRSKSKAEAWVAAYGGRCADTPAAAAGQAELVMSCVGADDDLRAIATGPNGALANMAPGSIFIDHTTTSAEVAEELAALAAKRDVGYLDAPVSGGQAGAEQGQLTIMVGGETAHYEAAAPILQHYAKRCRLMGPVGAGQLTKMVNQICLAGVIEGLAEGLHFASKVGLDPYAVVEVISQGAAQSWQMDHRHESMLKGHYDHGFAVDWMRKDLGIALAHAKRSGASLPLTALVDQWYAEVQALGGSRWDTSSLLARLPK